MKLSSVSLLFIAALLSPSSRAQAPVMCALGPVTSPYDPMADMPPSAAAQAELKKLKSLLCPKGCGKVLLFANATTPNTATVSDGGSVSKIAYSPRFVTSLQTTYGPIATLGIFAHDLGHHLDATGNRAPWMKSSWDSELRADAWAGCAMAKAELTPSRLQAALLALSTYPSPAHPEWSARRPVITEGYTQCGGRMLPPLGKEKTEQTVTADARKDDAAVTAAAAPGGCGSDKDCRNGRTCLNSRCAAAPERRRCGKDTDCPDPQECGANGYCHNPNSQARGEEEPAKQEAGPMLAALQSQSPPPSAGAPPTPGGGPTACQRSCDDIRNQCIEAAKTEANKCLTAIQSEETYRTCTCPTYPRGNYSCYGVCSNAYERGKSCAAPTLLQDCKTDGDRCRSECK